MSEQLSTKVYVAGSFEAVSEAAMQVWRSSACVATTSDGIRFAGDDEHPGLYLLELTTGSVTNGASTFSYALSQRVPTVLVACSVVGLGLSELTDAQCFWGVSAYIGGVELLSGLTGSLKSSLPTDIAALVDDTAAAGALPRSCIPRLHEFAFERVLQEARARATPCTSPRASGMPMATFPRWTLLTHAVNSQGLAGLESGAELASTSDLPSHHALSVAAAQEYGAGVASWADTLFFGSRTPISDADDADRAPYSSTDVAGWRSRVADILSYIGREDNATSAALIGALCSPNVTFQDGTHPLPWLVAQPLQAPAALQGMHRLIAGARKGTPPYDDEVRGQAIRAVSESGYTPESVRLAERMGWSQGLIASRCLPLKSAPEHAHVAHKLIDTFLCIHGRFKDFPAEVSRTFENASEAVARAFEAKCTEELMCGVINNWSASSKWPANDVLVTTKRRRRLV